MTTRYAITSTAWTKISDPGKDFECYLVDENTGTGDTADVRVYQSATAPADSDILKGRRVTRPRDNRDTAAFSSDDSTMSFYARCATNGASATLVTEMSETTNFERLVDQGKLFFLQTRTKASAATRLLLIRTGAKRLNIIVNVSASQAAQINLYEAPSSVTVGTAFVARNYNRNFADDGLLSKAYPATAYTLGTGVNISPNQAGFGSNPVQASSGVSSETIKYIFKPNTDYLYEVDPDGSTAIDTLARSIGWEEED